MTTDRAIPTAGPDFAHLLQHDPLPQAHAGVAPTDVPAPGLLSVPAELQREVEQLLYRQAELLDGKHWQAWIDCFDERGVYWMPVTREQTEWEGSPSIFAEDKLMMEIRKGRVSHPNAWSQAPMWETSHVVSHVAIESVAGNEIRVRSRFHMMELRRDQVRHFGGSYRHTLVRGADASLRILLQRVDLFNSQAPFEYVLQIWV
jgi:3-phenylpropionate/cinnamic acid dioxygenase small subunit